MEPEFGIYHSIYWFFTNVNAIVTKSGKIFLGGLNSAGDDIIYE